MKPAPRIPIFMTVPDVMLDQGSAARGARVKRSNHGVMYGGFCQACESQAANLGLTRATQIELIIDLDGNCRRQRGNDHQKRRAGAPWTRRRPKQPSVPLSLPEDDPEAAGHARGAG